MSFPGNSPASNISTMQAGSRSYQSAPIAPTGPSTSSSSNTRNSKLEQIIQNFYTKTAQIVVQARLDSEQHGNTNRRSSSSSSITTAGGNNSRSNKPNRWFNIATQDIDFLREELKYWRALSIQSVNEEPPPLILDVVLDVSQLTHGQILVLADDRSRFNKIDINGIDTILLERWVLSLNHPLPDFPVDLPNLYKRSIVFFRALYSFVRLLPGYSLHRRLRKYGQSNGLAINYRLTSSPTYRSDEIPLDQSTLHDSCGVDEYDFSDVVTPLGTFKLHVEYRRNCDFQAEDSERDLSARMIDMDEHFFTPTMVQHQQEQRPRSVYSYEEEAPGSRYVHQNSPPSVFRRQSTDSSDPRGIIQQRQRQSSMGLRGSPTSVSPLNRESSSVTTRTSPGEASTTSIGTPPSSAKRRTSAPHMSPFKSLPLSSSPQAEQLLSSGVRPQTSSGEKPRTSGIEDSSPSSRNKIEFSPSFDKIRNSPSRTETSIMARRWSRTSDHSSINFVSTDDPELEDFLRFTVTKSDLKLSQNRASNSSQMIESANFSPTSDTSSSLGASGYGSGSIYRSKKALSHYRNLRETHNTLSESLSSSVLASGERQESPAVYTSLGSSSTSSNSRPHLPAVRSPLHSEGSWSTTNNPSTSPIHIPRSYHQHSNSSIDNNSSDHAVGGHNTTSNTRGTATNATGQTTAIATSSAVRQHRRHHSSQNVEYNRENITTRGHDDIRNNDPSAAAYSSYPQYRHHEELRRLRVLESDSSSSMLQRQESFSSIQDDGHTGLQSSSGSPTHNQGGRPSSLDDDDSLVFKMSELGVETHHSVEGTTTTNENIVLHAHSSTRDYARRLGINHISSSSNNNASNNDNENSESNIATLTSTATITSSTVNDPKNSNATDTIVRRISSSASIPQNTVAMATVMEEEEKSGSGSNSSIGKNDSHSKYPQRDFW